MMAISGPVKLLKMPASFDELVLRMESSEGRESWAALRSTSAVVVEGKQTR